MSFAVRELDDFADSACVTLLRSSSSLNDDPVDIGNNLQPASPKSN
jgi:hypothetical protein